MGYRVTAYNAKGEMLYMVPDTDAVMDKTVATVGEAFDLMESLKSAFRWDSERHYDTGNGFIRNRIASFRIMQDTGHAELWTRAQVADYAQVRAARKAALAPAQAATEEPAEETPEEAAVRRSVDAQFPAVAAFLAEERVTEKAESAYCVRCHRDDLPTSLLCDREERTDLGADRDPELVARYEGRCLRCCAHNHG